MLHGNYCCKTCFQVDALKASIFDFEWDIHRQLEQISKKVLNFLSDLRQHALLKIVPYKLLSSLPAYNDWFDLWAEKGSLENSFT